MAGRAAFYKDEQSEDDGRVKEMYKEQLISVSSDRTIYDIIGM